METNNCPPKWAPLFEKASRLKLRFNTCKGILSVEDLWDLPLTSNTKINLDDIALGLHRQVRELDGEVSFVLQDKKEADLQQLQLDIVKHIITVRLAERDAMNQAAAKRDQKQRLLELIASKENEALAGKSLDELRAMVNAL